MGTIVKRKNKNAEVYTVRVRLKNLPEITATLQHIVDGKKNMTMKWTLVYESTKGTKGISSS